MSQEYCILNLLNIEDKNVKVIENFYKIEKFGNIKYKVIEAILSYEPVYCHRCGCTFNNNCIPYINMHGNKLIKIK